MIVFFNYSIRLRENYPALFDEKVHIHKLIDANTSAESNLSLSTLMRFDNQRSLLYVLKIALFIPGCREKWGVLQKSVSGVARISIMQSHFGLLFDRIVMYYYGYA